MAPNGKDEDGDLAWDNGMSKFLSRLEQDLVGWHADEKVNVNERRLRNAEASKNIRAAEKELASCSAYKQEVDLPPSEPLDDRCKALLKVADRQRNTLHQIIDLLRSHDSSVPSASDIKRNGISGKDVLKNLDTFLETADKGDEYEDEDDYSEAKDEAKGSRKRGRNGGAGGPRRRKRRRTEAKPERDAEGSGASEYSCSASPKRKGDGVRRAARGDDAKNNDAGSEEQEGDYSDDYSESRSEGKEVRPASRRRGEADRREARGGVGDRGEPERRGERARLKERSASGRRDRGHRRGEGGRRRDGGRGRGCRGDNRRHRSRRRGGDRGERGERRGDRHERKDSSYNGDIRADVEKFIRVNRLESNSRVEGMLKELPKNIASIVIGLESGFGMKQNTFELSGDVNNPGAVVMGRIKKVRDAQATSRNGRERRRDDRGGGRGRSRSGWRRSRSRSGARRSRSRGGKGGYKGKGGGKGKEKCDINAMPLGKKREFSAKAADEDPLAA